MVAIMAVTSLVGFAREVTFADRFGTGAAADAWGLAATVLAVAMDFVFMAGPLSTAVIPLLAERRMNGGPEQEKRAFSALSLFMLAVAVPLAALFVAGAGPIGSVLAPGFTAERRALLTPLLAWTGATLVPVTLAGVLGAGLASRRRFVAPALTGLAIHLGVLASLLWLVPRMGVFAMGIGVATGGLLAAALQAPALRSPGMASPPEWGLIPELAALTAGVGAIFFIREATLIFERLFASTLPTGQLAALYYAGKLEQLPLGLFGISVAVVAYPDLTELAISGRIDELGRSMARAVRLVLLLAVPSAVGLAALGEPIVRLVLQHGAFGAASVAATAPVLVVFSLGLVGQSTIPILLRGYISLRKAREPGILLGAVLAVNLVLDLVLVRFGATGLATAFAVTMTLGVVAMAVGLDLRVPFIGHLKPVGLGITLGLGSLALGLAAWGAGSGVDRLVGHATLVGRLAGTLAGVAAGLIAYWLTLVLAKVPELGLLGGRRSGGAPDA